VRLRGVRLRVRLRRRRALMDLGAIYERQAAWFAGERSRLLRRVNISSKRSVLDLGSGTGAILAELGRRAQGRVVGLDADREVLAASGGTLVLGSAAFLPFADRSFDLVFTQMFFMWAGPLSPVLAEIHRVLVPAGHLVACAEPDYGGAIEHPADLATLADLAGSLRSEGADVHVGRKLGPEISSAGFSVTCGTHPARPLEAALPGALASPELSPPPAGLEFLYLPYFWFLASRI
jgi:SAM-dependent methyltransferase